MVRRELLSPHVDILNTINALSGQMESNVLADDIRLDIHCLDILLFHNHCFVKFIMDLGSPLEVLL